MDAVAEQDYFGVGKAASPGVTLTTGGALRGFQTWFDTVVAQQLTSDEAWVREPLTRAYEYGVSDTAQRLNRELQGDPIRVDILATHAMMEIQGVAEAVSQQAMRAFAHGVLRKRSAVQVSNDIIRTIRKTGALRGHAVANVMTVTAHAEGVLDAMTRAGRRWVGIIPEYKSAGHVHDAKAGANRRTASRRAIARAERKLSALGTVNVATAGDDKVCPTCEEIAEDGPYDIDRARGLIPAHPNCRCAFIPVEEADGEEDD